MKAVVLYHPQSAVLLQGAEFPSELVSPLRIACGTSRVAGAELSEAGDFWPTYASWNSALFETSVILTVWEHADRLLGDHDVAFLHTDVRLHRGAGWTWERVQRLLQEQPDRAVGLTAQAGMRPFWTDFFIPESEPLSPQRDPMRTHSFEYGVGVWDFIGKYDPNLYDWATHTQPRIVYAHQFACSRRTLDGLGAYLFGVASRMELKDIGLWTPHVFERLIGLWLVRHGGPAAHTTAFWHYQSSGSAGPGGEILYGPRPVRFYRPAHRLS